MVVSAWSYRRFIWENAWRDLWYRFAGSTMGFLWNVINPLSQILIYTIVFSKMMHTKIPSLPSEFGFAIYLCAGLIPWIGFNETVTRCAGSFIENSNYLKKLAIPEQVFVLQNACSNLLSLIISMSIFIVICCLLGHYPSWSWIMIPVTLLLLQGFALGIGLFLAVMNAFFRDVSHMLVIVLQIWFWMTPIVYVETSLPDWCRQALVFNPLYHFIHAQQSIIVENAWPDIASFVYMAIPAILFPIVGYVVLNKLRSEIRDVL